MKILNRLIIFLISSMLMFGIGDTTLLHGDEFPAPVENWWEHLKTGETATFQTLMTLEGGVTVITETVITIDNIEGSKVTISTEVLKKGISVTPPIVEILDAAEMEEIRTNPPADQTTTYIEDVVLEIDGHSYKCAVYDTIRGTGNTRTWLSRELPPAFSGSVVQSISIIENFKMGTVLKSYTGNFLADK